MHRDFLPKGIEWKGGKKSNFTVEKPDTLPQPGEPRLISTVTSHLDNMYSRCDVMRMTLYLCELSLQNTQHQCNHEKNIRKISIEGH